MSLLDFMKNRSQPQPAAKASSQTPTQQAPMKPENLPDAQKAKVHEAVALLDKATQHRVLQPSAEEGGSNAALLQKQNNQDKVQAALSPTDNFNGKTALQAPTPAKSTPAQSPSRGRGISR
jgi:hypothetical protein